MSAPRGNKNALKHGFYSRAGREERKRLRLLLGKVRAALAETRDYLAQGEGGAKNRGTIRPELKRA